MDETNAVIGRHKWLILSLIFAITVINFVDRQTLSVLAPVLCKALNLSNVEYGRIVSALQFGLMSGEFPMGYLMDRWGARLGMAAAVMWWSAATGTQVFARSGVQFGLVRFWMGTGECGNYSGGIKTVTRLFSKKQRTLAIGIFNGGSMVGATLAPPLIVFLMQRYGFRSAFLVPAFAGALWVPAWWFLYGREKREERTTEAQKISLAQLLQHLVSVGNHVLPVFQRAGAAVLLVLDSELPGERAPSFDAGDWSAWVDTILPRKHRRCGGRMGCGTPAALWLFDGQGAAHHDVRQRPGMPGKPHGAVLQQCDVRDDYDRNCDVGGEFLLSEYVCFSDGLISGRAGGPSNRSYWPRGRVQRIAVSTAHRLDRGSLLLQASVSDGGPYAAARRGWTICIWS